MANEIHWSALGPYTTAIAGGASSPSLKNLASASRVLGNPIDDAGSNGGGYQYADWELYVRGASAFASGAYIEVYFLQAADGTNYEDGDTSTTPAKAPDLVFPVRAVATQQRIVLRTRLLPNTSFKPLLINTTTQAFTNTDNENILSYRAYSDEIQ